MRTKNRSLDTVTTETLAVHAGREDFSALGVHAPPLDFSTTYPLGDLDAATASFDRLASGAAEAPNSIYARLHNPTVGRFESALAALEGTEAAVAFGSGMAAVTAVFLARSRAGRHVVALRPLYGGTDHLLASDLLGLEVTWATADTVAAAIRPDTCLVVIETPGNPTVTLVDIAQVVAQAGPVPVLVDSTFASPILQRPAQLGAAYVLHSATKVLGGHSDVIAGVVATSEERARELREVRILTGGLLHPLAAYLLHRGLPTLPLRVERAQATAGEIARRLAAHPAVQRVLHPGLPGGDPQGLIGRQMSGAGSNLAFEVVGGHEGARRFLAALELITPAVSLGSTDTLIQHPAGLTHRMVPVADREALGITDGLLRLSVGLESAEDLWRDLDRGLAAAAAVAWEAQSTTA